MLLALLILAYPVLIIGAFEGAYNHVLKNVLYFGGASTDLLRRLFPPPRYEMPDDVLFEITGILQVVPAVLAARHAVGMLRRAEEDSVNDHRSRVRGRLRPGAHGSTCCADTGAICRLH